MRIIHNGELPPSHPNFENQFFKKNRIRLQVINDVMYPQLIDHTGKPTIKQLVSLDNKIDDMIRTLDENPMQRHPGASKTLKVLGSRYYDPDLTCKIQVYIDNCQMCIRAKLCSITQLGCPLEHLDNPCDGPKDIMEIDLVGEIPASNGYTDSLTTCDVFSRYPVAVLIRQPNTIAVTHALLQSFAQHAYVPKRIETDKRSALMSPLPAELMNKTGIKINHVTLKHAQTIEMIERKY